MTQPDWSKAPEGATHYNDSLQNRWLKSEGRRKFHYYEDSKCWGEYTDKYLAKEHFSLAVPRPTSNTQGLPEVGEEYECITLPGENRIVEVIGIHEENYWVKDNSAGEFYTIHDRSKLRPIPRTITIGDMEVPEPVREPLEDGAQYFMVSPESALYNDGVGRHTWEGTEIDLFRLKAGLIHETKSNCAENFKALIKASGGEVE